MQRSYAALRSKKYRKIQNYNFGTIFKELVQLSAGRDSSKATPKHHPTAGIVPTSSVASYGQRASKGLVSSASNSPVTTSSSSAHKAISSAHYHAKSQNSNHKSQPRDNPYSEFSSSNFNANPSDNFTNVPFNQNKRYYQTINYHHRNPSFRNNEKGWRKKNLRWFQFS